jgi:hypothetical protein
MAEAAMAEVEEAMAEAVKAVETAVAKEAVVMEAAAAAEATEVVVTAVGGEMEAEAQARESSIEAALERVRSKAMAMRTSEDIAETTAASFEELRKLGVFSFRSGVGILSKDSRTVQVFADSRAEDDKTVALTTVRSMDEHPALQRQYDSWLEQKDFEQVLRGDELSSYYRLSFFKGSTTSV